LQQPVEGTINRGLRHVLEERIAGGYKLLDLVWRELFRFGEILYLARCDAGPLPIGRRVKMHASELVAIDNDDGVLREVEQGKRLEGREKLKCADNVASWRQLKLGVAALRSLNPIGVTTPLHNISIAIGHCYQPKIVTDFAGIHFIVNPHV
jgi:hypothetical protein